MDKTASYYLNRKTPCDMTPTFRYIQSHIVGKTLDIGTGKVEYLEKFPEGSRGVDVSKYTGILRDKGLKIICADINQPLPFAEGSLRTVFCSHVIEHVDSPLNLIRESKRILVDGGKLILAVLIEKSLVGFFDEGYFKGHTSHLYGLSVECIDHLLEKTDFKAVGRYYNFPILNRILFVDRILQIFRGNYCQYFCTMHRVVAEKAKYTGID
jgi:SAM-dependent methyltransferase